MSGTKIVVSRRINADGGVKTVYAKLPDTGDLFSWTDRLAVAASFANTTSAHHYAMAYNFLPESKDCASADVINE